MILKPKFEYLNCSPHDVHIKDKFFLEGAEAMKQTNTECNLNFKWLFFCNHQINVSIVVSHKYKWKNIDNSHVYKYNICYNLFVTYQLSSYASACFHKFQQ